MMPVLKDERLQRRYAAIVAAMSKAPDRSIPEAMGSDAATEGAYRFLNNERVDFELLLGAEVACARQAVVDSGVALAVHDSSAFMLGGESARDDIGSLDGHSPGFLGHFALAIRADGKPDALGVLGVEVLFRPDGPRHSKEKWSVRYRSDDKESRRWGRMIDRVEELVERRARVIHVVDSEGDSYELLAQLVRHGRSFVVRAASHRPRRTSDGMLAEVVSGVEAVACRQVSLGARSKAATHGRKTKREPREPRIANLHVRACPAELQRPQYGGRKQPPSVKLHVVHVFERDPPDGEEPVDWKLYTSERIDTPEQVITIVDYYRRRWVIEEFFKALKTGCAYEKRQLENRRALLNALALLTPIARQLLTLRNDSRDESGTTSALTPQQVQILRAVSRRLTSPTPTARELMLAVAGLGGHLKHNGAPGWQSLGRGYLKLLQYEVGWDARAKM